MTPTKADWQRLTAYVAAMATAMRLDHWRIEIKRDPADEDTDADISFTRAMHLAHLRVAESFWALDAGEKREVVTHELLHVHTRSLSRLLTLAGTGLAPGASAMLTIEADEREELLVDALTAMLAPLLPAWED